jgi:hypothetical protein
MNEQTLTKQQIIEELQRRHSMKYLCYLALQEIMLDFYQDTTFLKNYDHDLTVKFKNMVSSLQRNSSAAYRFMQSHKDGEATIRQFHNLTRLFEGLHTAIDNGCSTFVNCLDAVERILIRDGLKEEVKND